MSTAEQEVIREIPATPSTLAALNASEIDQQIATAHRFPRSLKQFRDSTLQMVTLTESIATECIYALPRDGKVIEGPSARFAEVVASAWGNCRAGARIVDQGDEFVTAQGVFHDLERNVAITYEVQRRIVTSKGKRYSADMIGVTANAACSIALRNAILKGVPKAFWADMYAAARRVVAGDVKTLANRRDEAMKAFVIFGVTDAMIYSLLGVKGKEDITIEHLVVLKGTLTALQEGDTTAEQIFAQDKPAADLKPRAKSDEPKPANGITTQAVTATTATAGVQTATPPQLNDTPIALNILNVLKAKMEAGAISANDLFKKFNVGGWDDLRTSQLDEIRTWIANPC